MTTPDGSDAVKATVLHMALLAWKAGDITLIELKRLIADEQANCNNIAEDQPNVVHIRYFNSGFEAGVRKTEALIADREKAALERIYEKRFMVVLEPGVSVFVIRANDVKARIIELKKGETTDV